MSKQLSVRPEKCLGCRTCEVYCSMGHYGEFSPRDANVSVIAYEGAAICVPVMCMQCEKACCMEVCPVGAISRDEHGAFVMNYAKCIGCKMCMSACPLGNISFSETTRRVHKCDLCGGDPKCAKFCPSGAIVFEDPADGQDRRSAVASHFKDVFGEEEAR